MKNPKHIQMSNIRNIHHPVGFVYRVINESIAVKKAMRTKETIQIIEKISGTINSALKKGNKLLIAGNGGSAADAQHFAAEIVNRYRIEREPLPAIALTTDSSVLTSIVNDRGSDQLFSRQIRALGKKGDVFIGITTSGNSPNIVHALAAAREKQLIPIGLLGNDGGMAKQYCSQALVIPSGSTPRIQETHILVIHILCELIDQSFT